LFDGLPTVQKVARLEEWVRLNSADATIIFAQRSARGRVTPNVWPRRVHQWQNGPQRRAFPHGSPINGQSIFAENGDRGFREAVVVRKKGQFSGECRGIHMNVIRASCCAGWRLRLLQSAGHSDVPKPGVGNTRWLRKGSRAQPGFGWRNGIRLHQPHTYRIKLVHA